MYNGVRNESYGVREEIDVTLTTKGYLSDGCSHPVTINGGYGGDFFDVLRNTCILDLNGESGDDSFTVRSFIAAIGDCGELIYDVKEAKVNGGYAENCAERPGFDEDCANVDFEDGDDDFQVVNPIEEEFPEYLVSFMICTFMFLLQCMKEMQSFEWDFRGVRFSMHSNSLTWTLRAE